MLLLILPQIEEELTARRLDALLGFRDALDLKAEMMGASEVLGVLEAGTSLASIIEEGQIDHAIAQIDGRSEFEILAPNALQVEDALVELGGLVEIAYHDRKVP